MTIKVIDLYSENDFDPLQLVEDGYTGVIFKGGQGQLADVPRVRPSWPILANDAGLDVGWFWVVDSRYSPESQKAAIKQTFPTADFDELGLWLDVEKPDWRMEDDEYRKTPYAGWRTVESVARGVLAYSGKLPMGIYTGPGAFKLIFTEYNCPQDVLDWFAQMLLWTAQYPWLYVPGVSKPSLFGSWKSWTFWQWREGPDVDVFNGSEVDYEALFTQQAPDAYVIRRSKAEFDLCVTFPAVGALPLLDVRQHAAAGGWECAMNAGAGFDYVAEPNGAPSKFAIPRTAGYQNIPASDGSPIYYARPMLKNGTINIALANNPTLAPWCILAEDATDRYLIVTNGQWMDQLQAAQYVKARGLQNAWLMDSDRSAQIEEGGSMTYWPFGPDELVPVAIGFKRKANGGNVKGTAKAATNIKATISGQTPAVSQLLIGQYAFGTLAGTAATGDLVGFSHIYKADGTKIELGCVCKAYAGNLTLSNETEPATGGGTTPPPPPPPAGVPHMRQTMTDANGDTWVFEADGVKQ